MKIPPHQYVFWAAGLWLEILLLIALVRGGYRKFPWVFAYAIALYATTVIEIAAYTAAISGARTLWRSRAFYYWINEAVLQVLVFAIVISFIYRASDALRDRLGPRGPVLRRWLVPVSLVLAMTSVWYHRESAVHLSQWMTLVSRDLSFCSAILDLLLWLLLIAAARKENQLLMLSGGLGIEFAGDAIGHALRSTGSQIRTAHPQIAQTLLFVGGIIIPLTFLVCLYLWWQAFRRFPPAAGNSIAAQKNGP